MSEIPLYPQVDMLGLGYNSLHSKAGQTPLFNFGVGQIALHQMGQILHHKKSVRKNKGPENATFQTPSIKFRYLRIQVYFARKKTPPPRTLIWPMTLQKSWEGGGSFE